MVNRTASKQTGSITIIGILERYKSKEWKKDSGSNKNVATKKWSEKRRKIGKPLTLMYNLESGGQSYLKTQDRAKKQGRWDKIW